MIVRLFQFYLNVLTTVPYLSDGNFPLLSYVTSLVIDVQLFNNVVMSNEKARLRIYNSSDSSVTFNYF